MNIKRLVLDPDKVSKILKTEKIFRMTENINWFLATEEAKNAIEEAGIQDVCFKEIEVV